MEAAIDNFGGIDVLVNNPGIAAPLDWVENLTTADYRQMVEVHHLGTVYITKAAWPHMQAGGLRAHRQHDVGRCVGTVPKNSSYGSAKGAVLGFTRCAASTGTATASCERSVPRAQTRMATSDILAHVYDAPEEMFSDSMPQFAPERVLTGRRVSRARVVRAQRRGARVGGG